MALRKIPTSTVPVVDPEVDDAIDQEPTPENIQGHQDYARFLDLSCLRVLPGMAPTIFHIVALPTPAIKKCEIDALRSAGKDGSRDEETRGKALLEHIFRSCCASIELSLIHI